MKVYRPELKDFIEYKLFKMICIPAKIFAQTVWVEEAQSISKSSLEDLMSKTNNDLVNSPNHYTSVVPGIEAIEVTQHFNFNKGNSLKYIWRSGVKDKSKEIEDLEKAIWYIKKEIKRLKNESIL